MGNSGEAIADYTKSIELGRKSVEAYRCRAAAYENQGHGDKAVADYTEAMRLKPNEAELYWLRGLLRAKKGDHDEAVADFTEALRLEPKNAEFELCPRRSSAPGVISTKQSPTSPRQFASIRHWPRHIITVVPQTALSEETTYITRPRS